MSTSIKQILSPVLKAVSVRDFSRTYFRKPCTWFYDRLEGRDKEGNPVMFTQDDINTMITSLLTMSEKLQMAAYDLAFLDGNVDNSMQRIAVRLIYYKPVSPKHAVIALDDEGWQSFLKADDRERIHIVCKITDMEYMESSIRGLQWIPLYRRHYMMRYQAETL